MIHMATNNSNFDYIKFLDIKNIDYFNYLVHIKNLQSVLKNGIYSRNYLIKNDIPFFRIDYESVQNQRIKNIRDKYGFHIHDYIPMFFSTHTPMLYLICNSKKEFFGHDDKNNEIGVNKNDIAILKLDRGILIKNGVKFSNKNCACHSVELFNDVKYLVKLNWHDITTKELPYSEWWSYPKIKYEQRIFRFNKSAEILAEKNIPPNFIKKIIVNNLEYANLECNHLLNVDIVCEDKNEFDWS